MAAGKGIYGQASVFCYDQGCPAFVDLEFATGFFRDRARRWRDTAGKFATSFRPDGVMVPGKVECRPHSVSEIFYFFIRCVGAKITSPEAGQFFFQKTQSVLCHGVCFDLLDGCKQLEALGVHSR
ncbi:hypothetical protein [Desulfolithobacter sp.]